MASSLAAALRATARAGSAARGLERRASCRAASGSGRSAQSAGKEPSTVPAPAPPLRLYFSDWAEVRLPDKHRFPMDKYRATRLALEADMSLRGRVEILRSPEASLEDVLGVHDREYVSRVMRCALTDKEARAIGFPMQNPEQVTRSFASTGGTIAATRDVLTDALTDGDAPRRRVAAQIAGGTHHAFADKGEGFCVFNDIACAATVALAEFRDALFARSATPILVIDLDVHQGNGTAKIFEDNPAVVTFSMHGAGNYPWKTKMRSDHDVDLPDDTDDDAYLRRLPNLVAVLVRDVPARARVLPSRRGRAARGLVRASGNDPGRSVASEPPRVRRVRETRRRARDHDGRRVLTAVRRLRRRARRRVPQRGVPVRGTRWDRRL